jgi:FKBP-type peptidyl-prolyl cis-trans isomerase FkpA
MLNRVSKLVQRDGSIVRRARAASVLLLAILSSACSDSVGPPDFDAALGVDLAAMTQTASGLYVQDLIVGSGATASTGSVVTVRYIGWLPNGSRFDGGDLPFRVGVGGVIKGFDEGVNGMKVGGRRRIVIPPKLGYGSSGQGLIPPDSYLVFQLDLLSATP